MVTGLPVSAVKKSWNQIGPLVEIALERGLGEWSPQDIYAAAMNRDMQVWAAVDRDGIKAVLVTQIISYPRKKFCDLVLCAGEDMAEWKPAMAMIEAWAKSEKCNGLRIYGRRGWLRALGWRDAYTLALKEL